MARKDNKQLEVAHVDIPGCDLHVDVVLKGAGGVGKGSEPLNRLLPGIGNQGGFRPIWSKDKKRVLLCVIEVTGKNLDWPDYLDETSGVLTYYGDNKKAGLSDFHNTRKSGNRILRDIFEWQQSRAPDKRQHIPPLLVFSKVGKGYDYRFRGLAVPSVNGLSQSECLTAVWKIDKEGRRFLNYRAKMTILNLNTVSRDWLREIVAIESTVGASAPKQWRDFVISAEFEPLEGERVKLLRSKEEQLPDPGASLQEYEVLNSLYEFLSAMNPSRGTRRGKSSDGDRDAPGHRVFEYCAIQLCRWCDPNIKKLEITRATVDGGRDGVGRYKIGNERSSHCFVDVEFYIEAKLYSPFENGVGVEHTARLISRIKNRQFGFLITTSYVSKQAYKEILEDAHPVVIMSGKDIARLLIEHDIKTRRAVVDWVEGLIEAHGLRH